MAGQNIWGATDTVIITTNGPPEVPDSGSSQPTGAIYFVPTRVLFISESSSAPTHFQFRLRKNIR